MDKILKPSRLDTDPSSPTAAKEWKHWYRTFMNFIKESGDSAPNKLRALVNCVSLNVYELIEDCESAVAKLERSYVRLPNEVFARHLLATRQQQSGESIDEFLRELYKLSIDCNFKDVTAEKYREELVRDAFINGIASPLI